MEIKQFVLKYFLKKAEVGNRIYKIKKKKKGKKKNKGQANQESLPHKKQNKKKPLQQTKEKRRPDFITAATGAKFLTYTSSTSPLFSWLIYLPVGYERSFRIINMFINLLSILARCT